MSFTDPVSGRPYTVDPVTGQSRWADEPVAAQPTSSRPTHQSTTTTSHTLRNVLVVLGFGALFVAVVAIGAAIGSGGSSNASGPAPYTGAAATAGADTTTSAARTSSAAAAPSKSAEPKPAAPKPAAPAPAEQTGTLSQENARQAAENYLSMKGFSRKGLIQQLSSKAGDGYSLADATWGVDHLGAVNWNDQAVRCGRDYLDMMPFSRAGLIEQLSSAYGDQFTHAQAVYAADKLGLK